MTLKTRSFLIAAVFFLCLTIGLFGARSAGTANRVNLYFFWGEGCPHCAAAKPFLKKLASENPELDIHSYEVFNNEANLERLNKMASSLGAEAKGVPVFIIGDRMYTGYSDEIGDEIQKRVQFCTKHGCRDPAAAPPKAGAVRPGVLKVPLVGNVSPTSFSLPVMTLVIAGLDSFNPCAFFVLLFLLGLLIHTHSRKKMAVIGGTFVMFSGLVYFAFMAAWLNLFLVVGHLSAVTVIAGVVALFMALLNIKDFFFFHRGLSLLIPEKAKPNLFERMRNLLRTGSAAGLLAGTAVLAIAANSYEIICTAGFPMLFTRLLTLHSLSPPEYYSYLAFYNIIYVIPLAVIVTITVMTLGSRKLTVWQGRVLKLVSGLMMLCLSLIMLIEPGLLNNAAISAGLLAFSVAASALIVFMAKKLRPGIDAS